jgi:HEPN domain-containing protein
LLKSAEDRECLNYPLPSTSFGYHASQSVEKLMKALISARGEVYPFTHELEKLQSQLKNAGEILPALTCEFDDLQPYAVLIRYDAAKELTSAERARFIETVDILRKWIEARIAVLIT